jgi:peptide/nickel transport system substrate-binding protein
MRTRLIRLRFRRRLRKGQRQVEDLGSQAEQQIEEHLFKRFDRLRKVQRFVFSWIALIVLLIAALVAQNLSLSTYYQSLSTVPGGIYNEGIRGRFTNASPLYATSTADAAVSRLIFAGLLTYDDRGRLVGDLASDYSVDAKGTTYTVHLKPNLKWHDDQPLTSADVVFTYKLIQNPDAQSPLQSSWQGITVEAPDDRTVVFTLPGGLASFAHNMTNGIVPEHLLANVPVNGLRSADFNTVKPIGAGPFAWQAVEVKGSRDPKKAQQHIALTPFADYARGAPKLQKFVVQVFANEEQLVDAFASNQLYGVEGLSEVPEKLRDKDRIRQHSLPLRAANMVFFKTTAGVLADKSVRQALVKAADVPEIVEQLGYPARQVREPILLGQVGYDPALAQAPHDLAAARKQLDETGWAVNKQGIRTKAGKPLKFTLTAADSPESQRVAKQLQRQWQDLGVKMELQLLGSTEFQNSLTYHDYDAILNGITIGPDPDVFVYWDSSQADVRATNRLNLSEYNNATADTALEAGRTRLDPQLRVIKYKPFLQAWQEDAPALGLYQPRVLYLTNGVITGLPKQSINTATDRFNDVHNWQIREAKVTN